jgi:hypothetical protein
MVSCPLSSIDGSQPQPANKNSSANSVHQSSKMVFSTIYFRITQLGITIALILSIVGGTSSISSTGVYNVQTTSKASILLYIVCYLALALMALLTLRNTFYLTSGETRIMWAVFVALPLLLVRLIYSLLVTFDHKQRYSLIDGSALIPCPHGCRGGDADYSYLSWCWLDVDAEHCSEDSDETASRAVGEGGEGGEFWA